LTRAAAACLGPDAPRPVLTGAALDALRAHRWPGNVRELENAIQRAVIVCRGDRIQPYHLGLTGSGWTAAADADAVEYSEGKRQAIERFQREFVHRALDACGGNVSHAAERCGLTRAAFQRIMRSLEIDRGEFSQP
jgi:DNA-binding NtrC family response regulator